MFEYEIKISSRAKKSTSIKIVDGKVIITTPRWTSRQWIEELVSQKRSWIEKHLINHQKTNSIKNFEEGEKFLYLGNEYPLEITRNHKKRVSIKLLKNSFWLSIPTSLEDNYKMDAKKSFENFYRKRAKVYLWQRTRYYANILGVKFADIRIKDTKTRWGSCSSLGNINYSWRLILTPPEVADSVVAHEVCHLVHQHHKKTFWELLYRLYPSYKDDHKWLTKNKYLLTI